MKYTVFLFAVCLIYSCDPYYKLPYCIKNQTTDTLYVKYKNYPDSLRIVPPNGLSVLSTASGIGHSKKVYKTETFQTWFKENSLLVKKEKSNALKKVSESQWKYEKGSAILYVKK